MQKCMLVSILTCIEYSGMIDMRDTGNVGSPKEENWVTAEEARRAFIVHAIILYLIHRVSCTCIAVKKKLARFLKCEILTIFFHVPLWRLSPQLLSFVLTSHGSL